MKVFVLLLLCIDVVTSRHVSEEPLNDRPIIAVLGQDTPDDVHKSYIAASYVKYLEASGARVVPIPTHRTEDEVRELFKSVNGVLFPGGSAESNSKYVQHAQMFYDMAIQANKNGDYFPIWATCLGFETLHCLTAKDDSVVTSQISVDQALTLNFTEKAVTSRLLSGLSPALYKSLSSEKITYNHHSFGISANTYKTVKSLNTFYDVLSTNYGSDDKEFVSTVEGRSSSFEKITSTSFSKRDLKKTFLTERKMHLQMNVL